MGSPQDAVRWKPGQHTQFQPMSASQSSAVMYGGGLPHRYSCLQIDLRLITWTLWIPNQADAKPQVMLKHRAVRQFRLAMREDTT
jgi:hypothetical protein